MEQTQAAKNTPARIRAPLVLIIDDQEWSTRSIESILAPNGFAVMRAYTARKGLERALFHGPDILVIDLDLPDQDGFALCRDLRQHPRVGAITPILLTTSETASRQDRLEAYRAGAWDLISYPIDAEVLVPKLHAYVEAKFEADRLRDLGLVDEESGLYNVRGLERRAQELSSWAYRQHSALACVVIAPRAAQASPEIPAATLGRVSRQLRDVGRVSDVIGRLGQDGFAVLAPGADAEGAVKLAERFAGALKRALADEGVDATVDLRAGYDAVSDARETPAMAHDLLTNAIIAFRRSRNGRGNGDWIKPFGAKEA
jgi:PleD family two-component response regulator